LLIFDGDDTLWFTEPLYDAARLCARRLVESFGLDGAKWEAAERIRDVANVARFGHSPERFPTSFVESLAEVTMGPPPRALEEPVRAAAKTVFSQQSPPADGADRVLDELATGHTLALLTKGDKAVQLKRINDSGLARYFARVEIVAEKTTSDFSSLAIELGFATGPLISIGNSLASDINPALEAGAYGIWIDAHVWEYERRRSEAPVPDRVVPASSLSEVPAAVDKILECL
jgi:putative hydrolase of the HAD superfamily